MGPERPKIVLTGPIAADAISLWEGLGDLTFGADDPPIPTKETVIELVREAEIVVTLPAHPLTDAVIEAAPRLRLIATIGTGYDNIALEAAKRRKIPVSNAPGPLDDTTADLVVALLLSTARRLGEAERFLRADRYVGWSPTLFLGRDVHDATLGIAGMGRIGAAVAQRAAGFRMDILYSDERENKAVEEACGARRLPLEDLLPEADFVSLHVPLTPRTRHLIDAAALRRMKDTAILINTSRGPVVDERALAEALRDGVIAGAGLDVYEHEPAVEPLLFDLDNVVLLPHIASASAETRRRMAPRAAHNVAAFLRAGEPLDRVA